MNFINIAIVDDGVNETFMTFKTHHYITKDDDIILNPNYELIDSESHGTICARIIAKNLRFIDAEIYDIKLSENNIDNLILALKWCLNNNIDLINLSIGSTALENTRNLDMICQQLHRNGILIVAAHNNNGKCTLPAYLPNVIGIRQFKISDLNKPTDYFTFGRHRLSKAVVSDSSNSYACAYATSQLANKLFWKNYKCHGMFTDNKIPYYILKRSSLKGSAIIASENSGIFNHINTSTIDCNVTNSSLTILMDRTTPFHHFLRIIRTSKCKAVVFCDRMSLLYKMICCLYKKDYWHEGVYNCNSYFLSNKHSEDIPKVEICGPFLDCMHIINSLKDWFEKEGYSCIAVSCNKYSYLYNCIYIKKLNKILNKISYVFSPSLILINSNSKIYKDSVLVKIVSLTPFIVEINNEKVYLDDLYELYDILLDELL